MVVWGRWAAGDGRAELKCAMGKLVRPGHFEGITRDCASPECSAHVAQVVNGDGPNLPVACQIRGPGCVSRYAPILGKPDYASIRAGAARLVPQADWSPRLRRR